MPFSDLILILYIVLVFNPEKSQERCQYVRFMTSRHHVSVAGSMLKFTLRNVAAKTGNQR